MLAPLSNYSGGGAGPPGPPLPTPMNHIEPRKVNDVKINHGSLQYVWTFATSWRHWHCSADSRKTACKCFTTSILAHI